MLSHFLYFLLGRCWWGRRWWWWSSASIPEWHGAPSNWRLMEYFVRVPIWWPSSISLSDWRFINHFAHSMRKNWNQPNRCCVPNTSFWRRSEKIEEFLKRDAKWNLNKYRYTLCVMQWWYVYWSCGQLGFDNLFHCWCTRIYSYHNRHSKVTIARVLIARIANINIVLHDAVMADMRALQLYEMCVCVSFLYTAWASERLIWSTRASHTFAHTCLHVFLIYCFFSCCP